MTRSLNRLQDDPLAVFAVGDRVLFFAPSRVWKEGRVIGFSSRTRPAKGTDHRVHIEDERGVIHMPHDLVQTWPTAVRA